ncbi:MAG: alpha/beta hydrolase [Chthoniobacterales bacterium]|nr:alpha/beta hydrolase [Chthoniobacterales bacterium]
MKPILTPLRYLIIVTLFGFAFASLSMARGEALSYGWQNVDGINLFYREGGPSMAPTLVFLHGNPSSSIMYQEVMEGLAASHSWHVLAVDYPSFGYSDAPDHKTYRYTFDHLAETVRKFLRARGVTQYGLYMQDYGVPIGFRLIDETPGDITCIMVQNGVIHLDGFPSAQDENGELRRHWKNRNAEIDKRRTEYTKNLPFPKPAGWEWGDKMSPDAILLMIASAQRPGVIEARNDLWFDYGNNLARYPAWQATLRKLKVPVLVMWGSRDDFFTTPGALAYLRDAPKAEIHIWDTEHFATLDSPDEVIRLTSDFLDRHQETIGSISAR